MYNGQNQVAATEPPKTAPELTYQLNRFDSALKEQYGLISAIESKVHDILNRRAPESGAKTQDACISDFSSGLALKVSAIELNNVALQKIMNHLGEII